MPGIREEKVVVMAQADGSTADAALFRCDECGGNIWIVYLILPERTAHIQCVRCGVSYCQHQGKCSTNNK
jgi:hypothetical protein